MSQPTPEEVLAEFLQQNYGVLVTPDAAGVPTCQGCGVGNVFASNIVHSPQCPFKPFEGGPKQP